LDGLEFTPTEVGPIGLGSGKLQRFLDPLTGALRHAFFLTPLLREVALQNSGGGGWPQIGLAAALYHARKLCKGLEGALRWLLDPQRRGETLDSGLPWQNDEELTVFLVAGIGQATGSGGFLFVARLLRSLARQLGISLRLVFLPVLPGAFQAADGGERQHAVAGYCLRLLEAVMNGTHAYVQPEGPQEPPRLEVDSPFDLVLLTDHAGPGETGAIEKLEELGALLAWLLADFALSGHGAQFFSDLVDGRAEMQLADPVFGKLPWPVAWGRGVWVFPNRELILEYAHRLAAEGVLQGLVTEAEEETVTARVRQFIFQHGFHVDQGGGLLRRLTTPPPPFSGSLETYLERALPPHALALEEIEAREPALQQRLAEGVEQQREAVRATLVAATSQFLQDLVDDPQGGITVALQASALLRRVWSHQQAHLGQVLQQAEAARAEVDQEALRLKRERARRTRYERTDSGGPGGGESYGEELGLLRRGRSLARGRLVAATEIRAAAGLREDLAAVEEAQGDLERRLETLQAQVQAQVAEWRAEADRIAARPRRWLGPNGWIFDTTAPVHYDRMLQGRGTVAEREAAIRTQILSQLLGAEGSLLEQLENRLEDRTQEVLCRAAAQFTPRDVLAVAQEQFGEQFLAQLEGLLARSREHVVLDEGQLDPAEERRLAYVYVRNGDHSPVYRWIQKIGDPRDFRFTDHGDPSTLVVTQYRYNFPLGALAAWDEYDAAYAAQKQRYEGEELVPVQPHHVDLPPVQPIRDRHDPDLAKYLAWGRSLGLIVQNDEGLILEIEGLGSRPLGASEEEALDYLFAHQRYLVAIASRWIAHRVLHDQGDELLQVLEQEGAGNGCNGTLTPSLLQDLVQKEQVLGAYSLARSRNSAATSREQETAVPAPGQ